MAMDERLLIACWIESICMGYAPEVGATNEVQATGVRAMKKVRGSLCQVVPGVVFDCIRADFRRHYSYILPISSTSPNVCHDRIIC